MFRTDGMPWWATDSSTTAKASIAKIPSVDPNGGGGSLSSGAMPNPGAAEATGFALAAAENFLILATMVW